MSDLKPLPCPFCGGINIINCGLHKYCHSCGAEGPDADNGTDAGLLSAWNRRAQPAQAGQVLSAEDVLRAAARTLDSEVVEVSPLSCIKDFARAIEQAVMAKRVPQWLPIETAPQDGTNVLCWSAEFGARESRNITYAPGSPGHAEGKTDRWWEWLEPKKGWAFNWSPTHWMQLPEPPNGTN